MKLVDEVVRLSRCTPETPGTRIQSRNKQIGRAKIELKLGAAMAGAARLGRIPTYLRR
jgi:hypothetical protein